MTLAPEGRDACRAGSRRGAVHLSIILSEDRAAQGGQVGPQEAGSHWCVMLWSINLPEGRGVPGGPSSICRKQVAARRGCIVGHAFGYSYGHNMFIFAAAFLVIVLEVLWGNTFGHICIYIPILSAVFRPYFQLHSGRIVGHILVIILAALLAIFWQ